MKYQYNEMRPVLHAINQLMQRVDAANLREKQFMADAARELRTPIAAVLAQIHLLKQIDDPAERNEITADMEISLDRAVSLSRQLIDLARLETEDYPLKMEEIDLTQALSHTIAMLVPYALRKNIEFSFDGPESCIVVTDKQALFSIINNILNNAVKYCPPDSQAEVSLDTGNPEEVQIIIRDNGNGISEQYRHRLFSRFSVCRAAVRTAAVSVLPLHRIWRKNRRLSLRHRRIAAARYRVCDPHSGKNREISAASHDSSET